MTRPTWGLPRADGSYATWGLPADVNPLRSSVPVSGPATPSPGAAEPGAASVAGARGKSECSLPRCDGIILCAAHSPDIPDRWPGEPVPSPAPAIAAFIRARLDDLRASAHLVHTGLCMTLAVRGPCTCSEPDRRRRRAFTHGNLVDWAERVAADVGFLTVDDFGRGYDPTDALRHLAAEWSDHPDYLTE